MRVSSVMRRVAWFVPALALASLASCAPETPSAPHPPPVAAAPLFATSFICQDGNTPVQDAVCGNQNLAALDTRMAANFRQHIGTDSIFERDQIMAAQRAWLLSLPDTCAVTDPPSAAAVACLATAYQSQIATLSSWPAPPTGGVSAAAISHYVNYKPLDSKRPALCSRFSAAAAGAMTGDGAIDPSRLDGAREIAGTHGAASGNLPQGDTVNVDIYRAGLFGGYHTRARAVTIAGALVITASSVGAYIESQPDSGGRFGNFASQTGDYGAIDVFTWQGQPLALVTEVIGYNAPAPPGETSDAALFTLSPANATPACLFRAYTVPPPFTEGVFSAQPSLTPFLALIDSIQGLPPPTLAQSDVQDTVYLNAETRWMLFNTPLVILAQDRAGDWTGFLRHRHDQVIDALSSWARQSPANQAQFSHLLGLLRPAAVDLDRIYLQQQGISATDAEQATAIAMLELLWQATVYISPGLGSGPASPMDDQNYTPRYPILAGPET